MRRRLLLAIAILLFVLAALLVLFEIVGTDVSGDVPLWAEFCVALGLAGFAASLYP